MNTNNQLDFILGFGFATVFWGLVMCMVADCVYDHGKYVGKLEAAAPELAAEKEADSEK